MSSAGLIEVSMLYLTLNESPIYALCALKWLNSRLERNPHRAHHQPMDLVPGRFKE